MSDEARVVIGWGAFVVGGVTGNPALMMWGASTALQVGINRIFEPSDTPTAAQREKGRLLNVLSNEAAVPVIYGRTKVGVQIVDVRLHPSDTDILYVVAALALGSEDGSGIEDVDEIYFDERLAISNPVFESEPATTGVQATFNGKLSYGLHSGADAQAVDAELDSVFSQYDADTVGRGVAYIMLKLTYDPNIYPTGIPNITAVVKGQKVWDPRGTPAWAYSDSPALCILDYLTSKRYGAGVLYGERDGGASEIDEQSFIDAANYHDDSITMGPGSDTRFTCNGGLDTSRPIARNLADLLSSCRSELIYEGGKFRLVTPQVQAAETFELTPDNIHGEVEYWRGGTDEVPNRVICHYIDEANEWLPQEVTWPEPTQVNGFLAADNDFENVLEVALPFTVGHYRAQQIGMVLLRQAREDAGIILTTTEEGLKLRVGEVVAATWPRAGFDQAEFRVLAIGITQDNMTRLVLAEYDDDVYTLDAQVTRDTLPASSLPDPFTIDAPTGLTWVSDGTTVQVVQGSVSPRALLSWTPPTDAFLDKYNVQLRLNGASLWTDVGSPIAGDTQLYISGVVEGSSYDVQIQAVNKIGVMSAWVSLTNQLVSKTDSINEMAENPGFELGDRNWTKESGWAIASDAPTSHRGSWRGAFTGGTGALRNHREFPVEPGQQYLIEGWLYGALGSVDGSARARVSWLNASRSEISTSDGSNVAATSTYERSEGIVEAPAGAFYGRAEFAVSGRTTGTWYADDIRCTRKPENSGLSDNTESVDDAPSNEVARIVQSGTVAGPDADGEVAVTFPIAYNAAPIVVVKEFRVKSFDAGLGSGADQTLVLEATGITATGFTLRAILVGGVPTLVSDGDDFVASSDLDIVGETVECNLASLPAGGAYGDTYTVHYGVVLAVEGTGSDPFFRATVVVAFDTNDGGGWVERATASYQMTSLGGVETLTVSHATKDINVAGLGTNDDIRIRIKSITELGIGAITNLNVHGFNVATNGDAAEGVTWQEESVAATEVSAIDDASHFVRWEAKSAT